jgi:hypothetical protein
MPKKTQIRSNEQWENVHRHCRTGLNRNLKAGEKRKRNEQYEEGVFHAHRDFGVRLVYSGHRQSLGRPVATEGC